MTRKKADGAKPKAAPNKKTSKAAPKVVEPKAAEYVQPEQDAYAGINLDKIYGNWKQNLSGEHGGAFPIEDEYRERMGIASRLMGTEPGYAALNYIWAAKYAATYHKDFEKFREALSLGAEARGRCEYYASQRKELEFLVHNAPEVYRRIISGTAATGSGGYAPVKYSKE